MTIILALISSIIGAFIAHYLATFRMKKSDLSKFQIEAYSDFLEASAKLSIARRLGDRSNGNVDLAALNNAKSRIIACGDFEVVEALVHFWDQGATLELEHEILAYTRLIYVIRAKLGHKKHDLFDLKISNTLFKLEPSSYSYRAENKTNKPIQSTANASVD